MRSESDERAVLGSRALLLYPPGLDFFTAFCGCLCAGVVAIPAPPPDALRLKRTLPRLQSIVEDAQATVVLSLVYFRWPYRRAFFGIAFVVETLGFDPKDPLLRIDLDHGVISIAPVANGHVPNGHD